MNMGMSQKPPVITMHSGNDKDWSVNVQGYTCYTATQHCTLNFTRAIRKEIKITQARR